MEISESFEVASPLDAVFEALTDVERIGRCIAGVKSVRVISPTESEWLVEVRAGTIVRTLELGGRLVEARRPSLIKFAGKGQDVEMTGSVELEAVDSLSTRCTVDIEAVVTGAFAPLAELMAQGPQRQLIQQTIANIRALLDDGEPGPPSDEPFRVSVGGALLALVRGVTGRIVQWFRGVFRGGSEG